MLFLLIRAIVSVIFVIAFTLPIASCKKPEKTPPVTQEQKAGEALGDLPTLQPFPVGEIRSVLPPYLSSCPVYMKKRCASGKLERCEIYNGPDERWEAVPDPTLQQMYMYDRYYDLYHKMEGQIVDYIFTESMPPGTPEEIWGDPQYFEKYTAYGDAAGWVVVCPKLTARIIQNCNISLLLQFGRPTSPGRSSAGQALLPSLRFCPTRVLPAVRFARGPTR